MTPSTPSPTPGIPEAQVDVLMRLFNLRHEDRVDKAFHWFHTDYVNHPIHDFTEFKSYYPAGSQAHTHFWRIRHFYELAGVLIERGAMDEDLFFDLFGTPAIYWERFEDVVHDLRKVWNNPRLAENFQLLAERGRRWEQSHPPKVR
ncbi:MAG TPA: DUF4760 domain-containing protein [Candidatus Thermoplasmatota archaeon]|nr:DUF4760 domain-containing protein [Candidatus Thermoplasmatota archaeon]